MSETKTSRLSNWWKEWRLTILAVILITIMIAITMNSIFTFVTDVPATHVENLFVDIDNDGDLDLVVSAEVVLNEGPFGFEEMLQEPTP